MTPNKRKKKLISVNETERMAHTVAEAAFMLNCSQRKLWDLIYKRQIGHARLGRKVLIPDEALKAYLGANTIQPFTGVNNA